MSKPTSVLYSIPLNGRTSTRDAQTVVCPSDRTVLSSVNKWNINVFVEMLVNRMPRKKPLKFKKLEAVRFYFYDILGKGKL